MLDSVVSIEPRFRYSLSIRFVDCEFGRNDSYIAYFIEYFTQKIPSNR